MSLALLFSPQGSQVVGMGRGLAQRSAAARATYDEADATLDWSISATSWEGPADRLNDTRQTQPCLLTASVAAYRALGERVELRPRLVAGHSVGEYAALVAGGVLELPAALRLVARRASLMADADTRGGMAAVLGLDRVVVERIVDGIARPTELVVANDNAPGQVVISGSLDALLAVRAPLRAAGAKRIVRLAVSGAFHSPLMTEVADGLAAAFEGETWHDAAVPLISNVNAEPLTDATRIRALLAEQVRSPVEWVRSVERMVAEGIDTAVECGPGTALTGMVRRIAPQLRTSNAGDPEGIDATVALMRGGVTAGVTG